MFSILAAGLYRIVSTCLSISTRIERGVTCRALARSACVLAQAQETRDQTVYDTIYELSQKTRKDIDDLYFEFSAEDERAKLNINTLSLQELAKLPGLDEKGAENIIASDLRPFAAIEELLEVDGMTREVYNGLEDLITVHSDGKININTVSGEVLTVLGIAPSVVDAILNFRAGEDRVQGTKDDGIFENVSDILPKLKSLGISVIEGTALNKLVSQGSFEVDSRCRTLKIAAGIAGKNINSYTVIIDKDSIKQWKEF